MRSLSPLSSLLIACGLFLFPLSTLAQSGEDFRKSLQTQFIMAEAGDTIHIPAGNFTSPGSISLDEKSDLVIMGAGIDKTVISFKGQREGAEGFRISNCRNITLAGFTAQDALGDCIKAIDTDGIVFRQVKVEWTGKPKKTNGAYGFYPVSCQNVLIEHCEAIGASDAGIYVGQSHQIIVRHSRAYHNVAGIEIENSTMADVYDCEAYMNTGGILVFDLPGLPKKKGGNVRVYRNKVWENNYKNFAPKGNTVAQVPPGTGIMILATSEVDVYDNDIIDNRTAGTSIVSYYMTEKPINDEAYDPYPTRIYVHDNRYSRERRRPTLRNKIGLLLFMKFKKDVPDILYDGIIDPERKGDQGGLADAHRICIRNNENASFANLDAENKFKNLSRDSAPFDCERAALSPPSLSLRD